MVAWLGAAAGALALTAALLSVKIAVMRKAAREIRAAFAVGVETETNVPVALSSGDKELRALASAMNRELGKLRRERSRFQSGDRELKDAITNVSHDLRTPLTAISGYLDLLAREEKSERAEAYLAVIGGRVESLRRLAEELFRYSVIASADPAQRPERLSLKAVLEDALVGFCAALETRGIEPELALPEGKVERTLDRDALMRIFGNVISNAVKYSEGDLAVDMDEEGTIVFSNYASGLDEVTVGRLFDRFFTVESNRNSTGLGLSVARILTERMGGNISAGYARGRLSIVLRFPGN